MYHRRSRLDEGVPTAPQPGAVDDAIADAQKAVDRLQRVYTSQREHAWEKVARTLRTRVQAQRTELRRLNAKVHSLRGDVHLAQEEAADADQKRCDEVNRLRDALGLLRGYVGGLDTEGMQIINAALAPASRDSHLTGDGNA